MSASNVYANDQAVREVVERFESCSYEIHEFTHAKHITVAVCYLSESNVHQSMARMRSGLKKFSAHYGKMGYSETITRFWLLQVEGFLAHLPEATLVDRANAAAQHLGDKNLIFRHYSREHAFSHEAKVRWVEPDLIPLELRLKSTE